MDYLYSLVADEVKDTMVLPMENIMMPNLVCRMTSFLVGQTNADLLRMMPFLYGAAMRLRGADTMDTEALMRAALAGVRSHYACSPASII